MSRFQNKIVVGGSDRESSESEDEYMPGQEMVNLKYAQQCMYKATMYNVMIQNMMPCVPMPYMPPFGYPVPYPPMINEFPVNHSRAAGTYYRKGGRQHRYRRDKMKSRSRLEGDDEKYRPYHKQHHVVSRHQYYESSSESDSEDECIYTGEKGVPACKSVNRKTTHITDNYHSTLSRSNPAPSGHGDKPRLQNNRSTSRVKSGIMAACHKMPLSNPDNEKAVMTGNACQQGEHTAELTQTDMHIAACRTMPLCHDVQVPDSMDRRLGQGRDDDISIKRPSLVPSLYSDTSPQVTTELAVSDNDQQQQTTEAITQEENTAANSLPLSCNPPYKVANISDDSSDPHNGSQLTQCDAQIISASFIPEKTHASMETGNLMSSQNHQPHSNTAMQLVKSKQDGGAIVHPQSPVLGLIWRGEVHNEKYLQSLHSLRKMWAEWETKYRPPPVSVHTSRGAGP